jgi:hypothetical protein
MLEIGSDANNGEEALMMRILGWQQAQEVLRSTDPSVNVSGTTSELTVMQPCIGFLMEWRQYITP